jgi:hypothetical protein
MAIDCLWRTDAGTQKLKHRRCNTNANTDAATQKRTQMLKHRCWNADAETQKTQTVKVDSYGNRLVMEHAQVLKHEMLKHRCWLNHRCWNTDVET